LHFDFWQSGIGFSMSHCPTALSGIDLADPRGAPATAIQPLANIFATVRAKKVEQTPPAGGGRGK
jgi:hypothetical protein